MKICIAVPCLDMVNADFCASLAGMLGARAYDKKLRKEIEIAYVQCKGSLVMDSRNSLVATAQDINASHIFFLDSDMVFPPDVLNTLASHHKPIVAGTYVKRYPPHEILGNALPAGVPQGPLHLMSTIPLGCCLISMKVFEALPRPYFAYIQGVDQSTSMSEDTYFCNAARNAGFQIYLDRELTQRLGHIGQRIYRPGDVS